MTRQRRMIELVLLNLREAAKDAEFLRGRDVADCPNRRARVLLAVAVDDAIADLEHALSQHPCNHGACLVTTLDDGTYAHTDAREYHAALSTHGNDELMSLIDDEREKPRTTSRVTMLHVAIDIATQRGLSPRPLDERIST